MGDYSRSSSFVTPAPRDDAFSLFSQNLSRPSWLPLHTAKKKKKDPFPVAFLGAKLQSCEKAQHTPGDQMDVSMLTVSTDGQI